MAAAGAAADSQVLPSFWALSGRFPPSCLPSSLPYTLLLLCLIWQEEGRMLCLMPLIVGFALLQAVRAAGFSSGGGNFGGGGGCGGTLGCGGGDSGSFGALSGGGVGTFPGSTGGGGGGGGAAQAATRWEALRRGMRMHFPGRPSLK